MLGLGQYAVEVISSWVVSIGTLGILVVVSTIKSRKARAALDEIEGGRNGR